MRSADNIKKLIKNTKIKTNPEVNKAILNDLLNRLDKAESVQMDAKQPNIWRIIMQSPIPRVVTAIAAIIAFYLKYYLIGLFIMH